MAPKDSNKESKEERDNEKIPRRSNRGKRKDSNTRSEEERDKEKTPRRSNREKRKDSNKKSEEGRDEEKTPRRSNPEKRNDSNKKSEEEIDKDKSPTISNREKRKRTQSEAASEPKDNKDEENEEDLLFQDMPEDGHGVFEKYNKDKQWKLERIPHHLLPSFNLNKFTNINEVRDYPLSRVSLPHSVFVGSKIINDIDVCHRRTIALGAYMIQLKMIRSAYFTAKKKSKQVRKNEKNGIYNRTLIEFAKRRDNNPDKYFLKNYDFYYTGGNLCVHPETEQILHVTGNNMEKLVLSEPNVEDGIPTTQQIGSLVMKEENKCETEIFEVQFSQSQKNEFFVRRRLCISLNENKGDKIHVLSNFKSKQVPFISFAQDKVNTNQLAMSDLQHLVRIFDIETGAALNKYQLVAAENLKPEFNWNMIRSWDSHVYLYTASRRLDMIDTRVPEENWRNNYCGYEEDSYCSNFCSLALSKFDNLFYVGSNHKVYCIDRRFMVKNIEGKNAAVTRWTHQMSCCPLMMATSRHNDCEYITLQSPLSADLRICENIQFIADSNNDISIAKRPRTELPPEYSYKSPCLPYMPPSIESVLQEARSLGKCLKPMTGIVNRVKACNTGLSFIGDSSNPYILTSTSNGDLFARHLYKPETETDSKSDQATAADVMSRFEDNIFQNARNPSLQITEVFDFSGISKVFRCPVLSDIKPLESSMAMKSKRKYMGRWQKPIQKLYKYKDALVSDLLSIWDVGPEEEKDFNIAALQSTVADSTSLVSGWLNAAQSTMTDMTSIPMDVLNESCSNLETTFDETLMITSTQIEVGETMIIAKPKVAKKKTRYVKGF